MHRLVDVRHRSGMVIAGLLAAGTLVGGCGSDTKAEPSEFVDRPPLASCGSFTAEELSLTPEQQQMVDCIFAAAETERRRTGVPSPGTDCCVLRYVIRVLGPSQVEMFTSSDGTPGPCPAAKGLASLVSRSDSRKRRTAPFPSNCRTWSGNDHPRWFAPEWPGEHVDSAAAGRDGRQSSVVGHPITRATTFTALAVVGALGYGPSVAPHFHRHNDPSGVTKSPVDWPRVPLFVGPPASSVANRRRRGL